jgi:DNA-binding response OmpR family regulator
MESPFEASSVLAAVADVRARRALRRTFVLSGLTLQIVGTFAEALGAICDSPAGVVICDENLPDGQSWKELLVDTWTLTYPPALIVASYSANENLREEVLSLGGYDLLPKPFRRRAVVEATVGALRYFQYQAALPLIPGEIRRRFSV